MAGRIDRLGFPGIEMEETIRGYDGNAKFVPEWLIRMFFELENYGPAQQEKLLTGVERRLVRLDVSWSVKEQMKPEEAGAKCAPITKDIIRVAAEREISRDEARQAIIEEGGYELANLDNDLVDLIDQGRMDVVIFGQDRRGRMNAKREDLRFRSFDLFNLLRIFQSNKIDISPIKRYERKSNQRRAKGPTALVTRTGPRLDEGFEHITYVEQPTAEKRGLILVIPMFVIWNMGSIAIGDLAWSFGRFMTAVKAVDTFLDLPKPTKKEEDDEDDPTPNPDVSMEDEDDETSSEATATVN